MKQQTTPTNKERKRLLWIDYVKGVCMVMVILNHLYVPEVYYRMTYPFELVGFFFVAGYTFSVKDRFAGFLLHKIRTLVVPVVCFGTINAVLSHFAKGTSIGYALVGIVLQIPGYWDDIWFVACLFTMEVMFYVLVSLVTSQTKQFLICVTLLAVGSLYTANINMRIPWHVENACMFILFLWCGYFMKRHRVGQHVLAFLQGNRCGTWLIIALAVHIAMVSIYNNSGTDIHLLRFGNFPLFYLNAMSGLVFVFCLALWLEKHSNNSAVLKFLAFVGANTLVYYAFQSKVLTLLSYVGNKLGIYYLPYFSSIVYCCIACFLLAIPALMVTKYMPFLLGKNFNRNDIRMS